MSRATAPLTSTTFNGQKFVSVASNAELFEKYGMAFENLYFFSSSISGTFVRCKQHKTLSSHFILSTFFSSPQMSSAKNIRMPWFRRPAIGSNARVRRLRKLISTRYGMTASRITTSRGRRAVATVNTTEITVIYMKTMRIRISCRAGRRPSRSSGSSSRALNSRRSSRRLTRSTFMGQSIGTTLQTMKVPLGCHRTRLQRS